MLLAAPVLVAQGAAGHGWGQVVVLYREEAQLPSYSGISCSGAQGLIEGEAHAGIVGHLMLILHEKVLLST